MDRYAAQCIECGMVFYAKVPTGIVRCRGCFEAACRREAQKSGECLSTEDERCLTMAVRGIYAASVLAANTPTLTAEDEHILQEAADLAWRREADNTWEAIVRAQRTRIEAEERADRLETLWQGQKAAASLRAKKNAVVSVRTNAVRREQQALAQAPRPRRFVYIIQLFMRDNIFKIGYSTNWRSRVPELRRVYGQFSELVMIAHEQPDTIEREIHAHLARYRIYDKAAPSELFRFTPRQWSQTLGWLCKHYRALVLNTPLWDQGPSRADTPIHTQLALQLYRCR